MKIFQNPLRLGIISAAAALFISLSYVYVFRPWNEARKLDALLQAMPARILAKLSLEQKVGQLLHVGMVGKKPGRGIKEAIARRYVGGVILFGHNLGRGEQIKTLNKDLQALSIKASGIPLLISSDQEGGRVYRVGRDATAQFPGALALGQIDKVKVTRDVGFVTAHELRLIGINLVLAPVLDVNNNPNNPVINTRSFGSTAPLVTRMGSALARGIREARSIPTIKHFPGHGDTKVDSHLALPRIDKDLATLEKMELLPFRHAIRDGAEAVMSAHILYRQLDPKNPATLSPEILTGILRKKLKFKGIIMTDAMEMHAIAKRYTWKKSVRLAFKSGADIILLTGMGQYVHEMYDSLLSGFRSGELSTKQLDEAVLRQLKLKLRRGLFYTHAAQVGRAPRLAAYHRAEDEFAIQQYKKINSNYTKHGTSLVEFTSASAISSLRKPFGGLTQSQVKGARLFLRSASALRYARKRKLPRVSGGGLGAALRALAGRKAGEAWVIELSRSQYKVWNRTGKRFDKTAAPTLVLYPGNPFNPLRVPKNGALLTSFSPTNESLQALVMRALDRKPIRKANLILGPEVK